VVVLGAGPAGAAAAITLGAAGVEVVVVDPRPVVGWEPGEGLPAAAAGALRRLGVWPAFQAAGHLPCSGFLSGWGSDEPSFRASLLDPRGPSWQLDRAAFNAMLRRAARPDRLTGADFDGTNWTLVSNREIMINADFVVDASGRAGALARLLGVRRRVDSRLVGIAALLDDPAPEDAVSIVEAVRDGWWYVSRVPDRQLVAVLFTDPAIAGRDRLTEPGPWSARLEATRLAGPRVQLTREPAPRTVAAGSSALERAAGPGWVAAGDAACAHEPLSARGLHDALTGGIAAAEAILDGTTEQYADRVADGYHRYLDELDWYYRQEKRFPDADFWRSRQP
jgi:2-polyprenyl-6-methoxyphenol hydroxylase-like FAD-dependent oxidoreductase